MSKRFRLPAALRLLIPFFTIAAFAAQPSNATTIAPPANLGQLARISDAVVFAQAAESWVEEGETIPSTVTRFHLLEQVAGAPAGFVFEVREPGGKAGRHGAAVAGSPVFEAGRNYLLFLDRAPAGRWRSKMLAYGLLEEAPAEGVLRPLRQASEIATVTRKSFEPVGAYRKGALLEHLREVARGGRWSRERVAAGAASQGGSLEAAAEALHGAPASCDFLRDTGTGGDNLPIRWFGFEDGSSTVSVVATTPGQTGIADGGAGAVQQGAAAWTSHPDSVIRLEYAGTRARSLTCSGNFDYEEGAVLFNDPCNDLADLSSCSGTLAFGGTIYDDTATRQYGGEPWHPAVTTFVLVNNGAECVGEVNFREILAHELGHTGGFGHHNPPDPITATMSAFLKGDGRGASLAAVDKACASYAYHTFLDVPYDHGFWRHVEAIENQKITTGCAPARYCPAAPVTRAEMAVFLIRGSRGSTFVPPAARGIFADVPADFWASAHVEQLYADGITTGCAANPLRFCPSTLVSRAEMAAFLVRIKHGSSFAPPAPRGIFADVPTDFWAAAYIEQLHADGITTGCAANPLRYCPNDLVTRGEMAAFLARTFSLPLP